MLINEIHISWDLYWTPYYEKKKKRQEILYWLHYSFSYLIQQNHAVLEYTSYRYVNVFRIQNYFVK